MIGSVDPDREIVVIDDVLSPSHFAFMVEAVKSNRFPWYYMSNTHTYEDEYLPNSHGFIHWMHEPQGFNAEPSAYLNVFSPALYVMVDAVGMVFRQLIRARVNLTLMSPQQIPGYPHVDWNEREQYYSALFYLEDSDGETLFYDYKCVAGEVSKDPETKKVCKKVQPKANRGVVFNGHIAHSATLPLKHPTRTVVNFCFRADGGRLSSR